MIVKILDIETLKAKWLSDDVEFDEWWWTEGNGSCDCNRHIFFNRGMRNEEEFDDCVSNRYFIIDKVDYTANNKLENDYSYDIEVLTGYNTGYELESFNKCITILIRNEKIEQLSREKNIKEILDETEPDNNKKLEDANSWWDSLSDESKLLIYKPVINEDKIENCEHVWVENNYYDTPVQYCEKCGIDKKD